LPTAARHQASHPPQRDSRTHHRDMSATATVESSFDPRSNAIGFVRWLMAFMVIFSHAGPVGGFYGGIDLGSQWSDEQSLGGVAVCGFFFLSGYLITRSRANTRSTVRFFWR